MKRFPTHLLSSHSVLGDLSFNSLYFSGLVPVFHVSLKKCSIPFGNQTLHSTCVSYMSLLVKTSTTYGGFPAARYMFCHRTPEYMFQNPAAKWLSHYCRFLCCIAIVAPCLLLKIPQPRRVWWEPSIGSILFARARGQEQRDLPMSSRLHSNWADPTGSGPWDFRGIPKHKRAPNHPWTMGGWAQLSWTFLGFFDMGWNRNIRNYVLMYYNNGKGSWLHNFNWHMSHVWDSVWLELRKKVGVESLMD